jgi:hypothetical protein
VSKRGDIDHADLLLWIELGLGGGDEGRQETFGKVVVTCQTRRVNLKDNSEEKGLLPMTLTPNCISYPSSVSLSFGGSMAPLRI